MVGNYGDRDSMVAGITFWCGVWARCPPTDGFGGPWPALRYRTDGPHAICRCAQRLNIAADRFAQCQRSVAFVRIEPADASDGHTFWVQRGDHSGATADLDPRRASLSWR